MMKMEVHLSFEGDTVLEILDFIFSDHEELRDELLDLKEEVSLSERKKKMKKLFRHFYAHEKIEAGLFDTIRNLPRSERVAALVDEFDEMHETLRLLLNLTLEIFETNDLAALDRAFNDFDSLARTHMKSEEEILFPRVRVLLSKDQLKMPERRSGTEPRKADRRVIKNVSDFLRRTETSDRRKSERRIVQRRKNKPAAVQGGSS